VRLASADHAVLVGPHARPTNEGKPFVETPAGMDHERCALANHAALEECESRVSELGVEHLALNDQSGFAVVVFRDRDNVQLEFAFLT
jgi:hypothetical protein